MLRYVCLFALPWLSSCSHDKDNSEDTGAFGHTYFGVSNFVSYVKESAPVRFVHEGLYGQPGRALKVMAFSDVHGRCKGLDSSVLDGLEHFLDAGSEAAKLVWSNEADILIFNGDASTIPAGGANPEPPCSYFKDEKNEARLKGQLCGCKEVNFQETLKFVEWFARVPGAVKIFVPGNHEVCLDETITKTTHETFHKPMENDRKRKREWRNRLLETMAVNGIIYAGRASVIQVPLGAGDNFTIVGSAASEGRAMTNPPLGAFQYCAEPAPGKEEKKHEGCKETYDARVEEFRKASRELEDQQGVDLVVMHGPPDNVGITFGRDKGELLAAVTDMKPAYVLAGHYHGKQDWKGGNRTQHLSPDTAMIFTSVKAKLPGVCEVHDDSGSYGDIDHQPVSLTFDNHVVRQLGKPIVTPIAGP